MNRQKLMDDLIVGAVTVIGYGIVAAFLEVMVLICAEGGVSHEERVVTTLQRAFMWIRERTKEEAK